MFIVVWSMTIVVALIYQYTIRKRRMNMLKCTALGLLVSVSLLFAPVIIADTTAIQVYKGELRISVPQQQARDSLLVQYRSKTREVVRIGINRLVLTNTTTNKLTRLQDQAASLSNRIDHEGYWITSILYDDLNLGNDNYRMEGRLTLYLLGSQRTRNFSMYLNPESSKKPPHSTIDWGEN